MATSYCGKILRINLSNKTCRVEELDLELAEKFIGGRGLGTKLYMDEVCPTVDALSPENKVVIISGPLTGTATPTGCRYMVVTKSPLTGMIASSNSGGKWGAVLKYAGYDAIILEGKAETPCYVNIVDDKVELLDAAHLWGTTVETCKHTLEEAHKGASVLNIGPAGETLSLVAAVMNEGERAAGRSGVGAVVGSKNLKAICVTATTRSVMPVYDTEALKAVTSKCMAKIKENGVTGAGLPTYGTAVLVNIINQVGAYPTRNWQHSYDENADATSGETLKEKHLVKNGFCHRCPIGCGRIVEIDGKHVGGPEYETIWGFGSNCGITDLEYINRANLMCNEMGNDTISVSCTIAAAMELYQKGYIKEEECEGVPLIWGNGEAIVVWTERMGRGETALGKLMAQGSHRLCEHYGHPEIAMVVKKQELPAYDARGIQGIGITYATSNRGGCHVRGYMIAPEILGSPEALERTAIDDKHVWAKIFQDLTAVIDSSGLCLFTSFALGAAEYAELINAATGTNYDVNSLLEAGERVYNLERVFNQKAGMDPSEDTLPKRLLEEPIAHGVSKGHLSRLDEMLPKYYEARGWENAFPTQATLERLGL
ncbi:MAG: aldehyde ferredoxin oxidoreductase family protein [Oscillospiraceae bacterium]|nr:aldehyde ferredoxin oxidoreductase family protein [Oscillospiraceae bacterium]